jgi:hypothetical protein
VLKSEYLEELREDVRKEAREEGLNEGLAKGRREELWETILELGPRRFGRAASRKHKVQLEEIADLGVCPRILPHSRMGLRSRWAWAFSALAQPSARTFPLNTPRQH